jgi:hypothetical protein
VWAEQLAELAIAERVSVFFRYRESSSDVLRCFAGEVTPAVREVAANG